MKKLLDQGELFLHPIDKSFNINEIKTFIAQIGFSLEHPSIPLLFLIFSDEQFKITTKNNLEHNGLNTLPYVLLIEISEEKIYINQFAGHEYLEFSKVFLTWLLNSYNCLITNESGKELIGLQL